MGRASIDETYLSAFNAAVMQREQIFQEFDRLKNRRILVEAAARALEPVVYPDEYQKDETEQGTSSVNEIPRLRTERRDLESHIACRDQDGNSGRGEHCEDGACTSCHAGLCSWRRGAG